MSSTYRITLPIEQKKLEKLNAGDIVYLTGKLFTARDKAHKKSLSTPFPFKDVDTIYHCGPLVKDGKLISAGPTTSSRMDDYTPDLIGHDTIRLIIGKGGMGSRTSDSLKGKGVYLAMTGGCGALATKSLKVVEQKWKELGMAESLWLLQANEFGPLVVSIDSRGNSLYSRE